jgi:putative ABC transport system permease protein
MSWWSRIANVFRPDRLSREIDEELQCHIEEAIAEGRDPAEARRALGSALRLREESRDVRIFIWLDSLRADAVFGWRQLLKRKVISAAAILSLASGDRGMHFGFPAHRCPAAAALAGVGA